MYATRPVQLTICDIMCQLVMMSHDRGTLFWTSLGILGGNCGISKLVYHHGRIDPKCKLTLINELNDLSVWINSLQVYQRWAVLDHQSPKSTPDSMRLYFCQHKCNYYQFDRSFDFLRGWSCITFDGDFESNSYFRPLEFSLTLRGQKKLANLINKKEST